jgi:hypothetical protein
MVRRHSTGPCPAATYPEMASASQTTRDGTQAIPGLRRSIGIGQRAEALLSCRVPMSHGAQTSFDERDTPAGEENVPPSPADCFLCTSASSFFSLPTCGLSWYLTGRDKTVYLVPWNSTNDRSVTSKNRLFPSGVVGNRWGRGGCAPAGLRRSAGRSCGGRAMAGTVARRATGSGGLTLGQEGCAPAGRRTKFHAAIVTSNAL